jgi:hypothetical protein
MNPLVSPGTALLSALLGVLTYTVAKATADFKTSKWGGKTLRSVVGDFGPLIAVATGSCFAFFVFPHIALQVYPPAWVIFWMCVRVCMCVCVCADILLVVIGMCDHSMCRALYPDYGTEAQPYEEAAAVQYTIQPPRKGISTQLRAPHKRPKHRPRSYRTSQPTLFCIS